MGSAQGGVLVLGQVFRSFRIVVLCGIVLAVASGVLAAQRNSGGTNEPITPPNIGQPTTLNPLSSPGGVPDGGIRARMAEQRVKSLNDSRHQRLEEDVERLSALAKELRADLDNTNTAKLSPDDIKKAGEIEKLAHDVQNRMKN